MEGGGKGEEETYDEGGIGEERGEKLRGGKEGERECKWKGEVG